MQKQWTFALLRWFNVPASYKQDQHCLVLSNEFISNHFNAAVKSKASQDPTKPIPSSLDQWQRVLDLHLRHHPKSSLAVASHFL
jgi:hypothetical protein